MIKNRSSMIAVIDKIAPPNTDHTSTINITLLEMSNIRNNIRIKYSLFDLTNGGTHLHLVCFIWFVAICHK